MANALRALAMDAVQQAQSGHPGAPMGMAEMALALWAGHLRHNPANPQWADRDRFVLSNGHASMLLYALLHLTGYDLPVDELQRFRQLHSQDAGPSGSRPDARRRDHHRAARPGPGQRGGHGAGREAAGRRVQPARPRGRRSPHLRVPRRRLPDGRHQPRGGVAGRRVAAAQADRAVRRQRHLDRRPGGRLVHRRHAGALSRLWLAGHRPDRRPRRRRRRPRHRRRPSPAPTGRR